MINFVRRFGQLYEGESYKVFWFALLGALLQAGIGIGYVGSDSLFISYLGVEKLPYIYFILPFCMLLIAPVASVATQWLDARKMQLLTGFILMLGGVLLFGLDRIALSGDESLYSLFFAIKLFSLICYVSVYTIYWNFVDNYFDILSAKRLFPLLGGACAIGSMLGGYLVTLCMHNQIPVSYLFLVWSILAAFTLIPIWKLKQFQMLLQFDDAEEKSLGEQMAELRAGFFRSRYAQILAVSSFCLMILVPMCEYQYMQVFQNNYRDEQQLADLLGTLFMIANCFNTFVIFFLFNRMVVNLGVRNIALIQPIVYLVSFAGYIAVYGSDNLMYWLAVFGFFAFQGIHTSVEFNNFNFIVNPIPRDIKASIRMLIEGWTEPFGSAAAGLILIVLHQYFGFNHLGISVFAACMCLVYLVSILSLRSAYTPAMIDNLRSEWLDFSRDLNEIYDRLSQDELQSLRNVMQSGCLDDRISACRCLWHNDRILALSSLLELWQDASHEEREAYGRLLGEMFSEQDNDVYRLFLDWLIIQDTKSKQTVVQWLDRQNLISVNTLLEMMQSDDPDSRASASGLLWNHWDVNNALTAMHTFQELMKGGTRERQAAIRSLSGMRESRYAQYLKLYLDDADPSIRRAAHVALTRVAGSQNRNLMQDVIHLLDDDDDDVRTAVFHAIERIGDSNCIPPMLERASRFSPCQRRQAQQAIFSIGLKSVPTCISVLRNESYSHEARSIAARAVTQMAFPQMESLLPHLIDREIHRAYRMIYSFHILNDFKLQSNGFECLTLFYQDEQLHSLRFILELLSLGGRIANHEMIAASLRSTSRTTRSNAIETLEQSVNRSIYRLLLPLVDGRPAEQQVEFYRKCFRAKTLTAAQIVESAWKSSDPLEKAIGVQAKFEWAEMEASQPEKRRALMQSDLETIGLDLNNTQPMVRRVMLSLLHKLELDSSDTLIDRLVSFKQTQLFSPVLIAELTELAERIERVDFQAGDTVYRKGEEADAIYIERENGFKRVGHSPVSNAGESLLGEEALLENARRGDDAMMLADRSFYRLPRLQLLEYARVHPNLAMQWVNMVAAKTVLES